MCCGINLHAIILSMFQKDNISCGGLYWVGSLINHNCSSNAKVRFEDGYNKLIIKAEKFIKKGEEITISYVGGNYSERQNRLKMQYGFNCNCKTCLSKT
jgi:SET domain-containing protein